MKTFFSQLFFAVAMFSGVVSVLADTTLFDWNDPGNAVVFATEITTLSHGGRPVEVNYAIKDNTLYSRVSFGDVLYDDGATEPSSEAASRGLRGFNIFGGYERAAGNVQEDYNFFFSRPNALWSYYEHAVQNDAVYAAYFNAETGFSQFFASNYLLPDGRDYFIEGVAGNSSSFVGGIDMHTKHEGLTYFIDEEEENGISESSQIGWSLKGNEGTEGADFTATYSDGVLEVSANGNFLFSFNYSEGNSYLEYAVSLD
ncbi:MAG: hypothetical protein LBI18_12585, partial [Planctomycetaceae bacterium]|nr:hypothetical protein [Planctomycetaceae bacterium]